MLQALSNIADIVSGILVGGTLVLLMIELKQNNRTLRSVATQGAHDQVLAIYTPLMSDPSLTELFLRGGAQPADLTPAETVRLYSWYICMMFQIQNWYFQAAHGSMSKDLLDRWAQVIANLHNSLPGLRLFWNERRYMFLPDFAAWFEKDVLVLPVTPGYRPLGLSLEGS